MSRSDDVKPTPALTGRLLRALGLPSSPLLPRRQRLQRGLLRHGVSTLCWTTATETTDITGTDTTDANALELTAWPYSAAPAPATDPSTPTPTSTTDSCSPYCDCEYDPFEGTTRRRHSLSTPPERPQGHRRANSLDSTTTDSSIESTSSSFSSVSSRSRWNLFSSATDELNISNRRPNGVDDKRSKKSREVWREYW
ncbi:hypothetical protein CSAL01_07825 [Colletotrichum salicis]|uniref:Uncharacterized protein n=1 Tax=Colletotrichum salicis TaxID=1209931 RepID=A0A135V9V2_9PEZI|nr:hypothetical protein CSAL01_07825 [Colletotrichum salicis]